jgi:NAD+ kinase
MSSIERVGLVAKHRLDAAAGVLAELAGWLEARAIEPVFETDTAALAGLPAGRATWSRDDLPQNCNLIVVLGGDGTLIGMADRIAAADVEVPILGVNFGSLGFLTEIPLAELYESLEEVLADEAEIDSRMMLRARSMRNGSVHTERLVLNDVVITRGALSRIIELSVADGDEPIMCVRADGLIVHPELDAMLLTPIAPHMLTNRPVIVPADATLRVRPLIDTSNAEVFATFDGQSGHPVERDDVIEISRAERALQLVRSSKRTYFDVLRQKLKWGER